MISLVAFIVIVVVAGALLALHGGGAPSGPPPFGTPLPFTTSAPAAHPSG